MKVLVLAQNYPYPGHSLAAPFNEHSVKALRDLCDGVEVLVPRPYAPPALSSLVPRWQVYAQIPAYEMRKGIPVYRPAHPQLPRLGGAFWGDQAAFWWCRRTVMQMHHRMQFDALLAFDIIGVGGWPGARCSVRAHGRNERQAKSGQRLATSDQPLVGGTRPIIRRYVTMLP